MTAKHFLHIWKVCPVCKQEFRTIRAEVCIPCSQNQGQIIKRKLIKKLNN